MKYSNKHLKIFKTISEKGFYKSSNDQEIAIKKLIEAGLIEWRGDYRGVIFTPKGKDIPKKLYI